MMKKKKFKIWRVCSGVFFSIFFLYVVISCCSIWGPLLESPGNFSGPKSNRLYSNSNLNLKKESMAPS